MKFKHHLILFTLTLFVLASCAPLEPIPQSLSATIAEIENDVQIKRAVESPFEKAIINDKVDVNNQIKTNEDSRSRVDLSSGTVIRIAPNSLFILEENHGNEDNLLTRIKIITGKVWIVLNGGSLEVETPSGLAGVRGSYMSTGYDPESGAVRITCLEGQCAAENENGAVSFTAGEAADLPANGASPVKGEMTDAEYRMWAENVPEAETLLPSEAFATITPTASAPEPTSTPHLTSTPQPQLGSCTVNGEYLYIRSCASSSCDTLGYAEKDAQLELTTAPTEDGWMSILFEGEAGWVNENFCE
ncbi:MAG: FecR domain-containing protein [Anaerolineae bacterium]|jgi:hypothetical protein|nr:FecR domain-containing protein [Anaerolineae bacterium]MBT7074744.1 FecR domain-containing protein [Anaerolineae bacterium]MBT7781984.1 FecR domain-containing protein [Anaerolineae bacterium]